MGQKVGGYRRKVPYGQKTVRIHTEKPKTEKKVPRSWRFEVNPEGRRGWNRGTSGRVGSQEKAYGSSLNEGRRLRKEVEELRKGFGCVTNGLGRKGTKETGYQVYGEYTYEDRRPRGEGKTQEGEESQKEEGKGEKGGKPGKEKKKGKVGRKTFATEKEFRTTRERARERLRRKAERQRKAKVERKRTNLKERRKEEGMEGIGYAKKERKSVLGYTTKRKKPSERAEAIALSGCLPTTERRTKLIAKELEAGLNHMEVRRNRENLRTYHSKREEYGRKKEREGQEKREKAGYYGYQILVKGPLGGARRTMTYGIQKGKVPRGTKKARRTTSFEHAKTKIGTIGVKVTYCYGLG